MSDKFFINSVNESSLLIRFETTDMVDSADTLAALSVFIQESFEPYIKDVIFSYVTLLIAVDTQHLSLVEFKAQVESAILGFLTQKAKQKEVSLPKPVIKIPVFYHPKVAPDLSAVAEFSGLSVDAVVEMHCSKVYSVCAIGFAPGFSYLAGVDKKIAKPRLDTPRLAVAKGSVGIAGVQTGVYPAESPGGWNIIGRTPLSMLVTDEGGDIRCRVSAGSRVKFCPINESAFLELGGCL